MDLVRFFQAICAQQITADRPFRFRISGLNLWGGELEKLLLLPAEFGGTDDPRNIVYVPRGFVGAKQSIGLQKIWAKALARAS